MCEKAQHCLGTRHYKRALHVTKGPTPKVKPQVHAGWRQPVRNVKLCVCLHVPVGWATAVLPMQVGGGCLLGVGCFAEGGT